MAERQKIAVDLDGTLAHYESGQWPEIGKPIEPMMARVHKWIEEGHEVIIFTARASQTLPEKQAVRNWLTEQGLGDLEITCVKTPDIDVFWDDKAIQVLPNTGECISNEKVQESCARQLPPIQDDFRFKPDEPLSLFKQLEDDNK